LRGDRRTLSVERKKLSQYNLVLDVARPSVGIRNGRFEFIVSVQQLEPAVAEFDEAAGRLP
jgi:hypothetical protein